MIFKRRHFRTVLLEWAAYGTVFLLVAAVGACQSNANMQENGSAKTEKPAIGIEEPIVSNSVDDSASGDPAVEAPSDSAFELSETPRNSYNSIDLTGRSVDQLSGQDPITVTETLFSTKDSAEGRYGERSELVAMSNNRAVVHFVQDELPDDSVQAIRRRVEFTSSVEGWQLTWAGEQYRCREGRGSQDWSTALCS